MKKLLLAAVVSMAVTSIPAFAHQDRMNQNADADDVAQIQDGTQQSRQIRARDEQSEQHADAQYQNQNQQAQDQDDMIVPDSSVALTELEAESLVFMREEEKLARDVYLFLYEVWGTPIFKNIANAEQKHMDSVKAVMEFFAIEDVALADQGDFSNPALQEWYSALVVQGSDSLVAALSVGVSIEETDIVDLKTALGETENPVLTQLYLNLLNGSYNHLRAFVNQLEQQGVSYEPDLLTQEEADSILQGENISSENTEAAAIDEDFYPVQTRSRFSHSLTTGSGTGGQKARLAQTETVKIASHLLPEKNDIGQMAESLIVVQYQARDGQQSTFMRSGDQWKPWNGDAQTLSSAGQRKLNSVQQVNVYEGELGAKGAFAVFTGYRLNNGRIVYSAEPLEFDVD